MKPIKRFQLGKKGVTKEFVEQIRNAFKNEQLIKISILKSACRDKKQAEQMAQDLVNALGPKFDYKIIGYVLAVFKCRQPRR